MAKKGKKKNKKQEIETTVDRNGTRDASLGQIAKMKNKEYEAEIFKLQVKLVKLQEWVKKLERGSLSFLKDVTQPAKAALSNA